MKEIKRVKDVLREDSWYHTACFTCGRTITLYYCGSEYYLQHGPIDFVIAGPDLSVQQTQEPTD